MFKDEKFLPTGRVEKQFDVIFNRNYKNGNIYVFLSNFLEKDASFYGDIMMRFYYQSILELMR